jgi:hypothetical protein
MKIAKWERNHHTIKPLPNGARKPYKSVNEAKRRSRGLQLASDGALGRGSVRLAT